MMNLSGDAPAPINQVKFIMPTKLKQFWLCNELLPCIANEYEIIRGVKFILAPRCILTCSGQLCEQSGVEPPLGLCLAQAGR